MAEGAIFSSLKRTNVFNLGTHCKLFDCIVKSTALYAAGIGDSHKVKNKNESSKNTSSEPLTYQPVHLDILLDWKPDVQKYPLK